jgi:exonuclease SbcC
MRLHHLEVVAFGPFAERVEVDFDSLSDAGLFLLTGATGAGKTSVLDAVCFGLYGAVPGDRQSAKRLRSDHAPAGAAPAVTLEFSVAGRRFRIARSPAWERPRKRGSGTTREQARVLLSERRDDEWQPLATRLDEAGHLVSSLLGMTLTQFCQVQLLPQGRFQAFLRAESDERHRLLQRLFRTSRFEDVELWLRERRRDLRRESARHHDGVADAVSRISEAAGRPVPDSWDLHQLDPVVGDLLPWATEVLTTSRQAADAASREAERAAYAEAASGEALGNARVLADLQQRHVRAVADHGRLTASTTAHRARLAALDAARRAAAVLPLREVTARAQRDADRGREAAEAALARARRALGQPECALAELGPAAERAAARAADARARAPQVEELAALERALAEAAERRRDLAEALDALEARAAVLPDQVARSRADESAAARAADSVAAARQEAEAAAARLEAGVLVAQLVVEKSAAETRHREAVAAVLELKEHWLMVQERRLAGMAAELAGAMAVGDSCPVCGSADHPRLARAAAGAPDLAAERDARRAVDDAEAERHARAMAVHDLETRIRVARERAGHRTVPVLERECRDAAARLARLESRADGLAAAADARRRLEDELAGLVERRTELTAALAGADALVSEQRARAAALAADLAALLDGTGHDSLDHLARHLDAVAAACREALEAAAALERAEAAQRTARERAVDAAVAQGFRDLDDAGRAALPGLLVDHLDQEVRAHEASLAAATAALADPELRAAAEVPPPDLDHLAGRHDDDRARLASARTAASLADGRLARLERLRADLASALDAWGPLRSELELAERMASLADGTSADNRLRMRLSAYVLGYRLTQVVEAANERLARMFDHRYTLEHSGDRGVGESRGGLSLRVRDDWTGESRDPATLSGGETFVVSLALALGLADVIAHEAGGAELDTLFVDEGFGSLDAETLDQVMDTLDSLRDGGRVVGVVSHVAELRDRIPTQLHVTKQRAGSTIRQPR